MIEKLVNCIDVRRLVATDPGVITSAMEDHLNRCAACRKMLEQEQEFNVQLNDAMQVPVPEGLHSRILLRQSTNERKQQRRFTQWTALAASIAALAITLHFSFIITRPVEAVVLTHIQDELNHLVERNDVQLDAANYVLQSIGQRLTASVGTINYAGKCKIRRNQPGAHLVLNGSKGPVTVLLMPGEKIQHRRNIRSSDFDGVIVPTQDGSIAIVGGMGESHDTLNNIERLLLQALHKQV
jgi:hypothetical protein